MRVHLRGGFTQPVSIHGLGAPAALQPPPGHGAPHPRPPWHQPRLAPQDHHGVRLSLTPRPQNRQQWRAGTRRRAVQTALGACAKATSCTRARRGSPWARVWSADGPQSTGHARLVLELELEEVVGYLGPALAGEDEHPVPAHGRGKVAAGGRDLAALGHLCGGSRSAPRGHGPRLRSSLTPPCEWAQGEQLRWSPHDGGGRAAGGQTAQDPSSSRPHRV